MVDRKLGRGLDFFLSGSRPKVTPAEPARAGVEEAPATTLPTTRLAPNPNQPRKHIGEAELNALADSIRQSGILQPILVRKVGDQFEIVAGERRWRAAQLAGLEQVPVHIRAFSDEESAVLAMVENLQREDLNAMEKASAFQQLATMLKVSQEEIAKRVGLDRSTVANFIRLLDLAQAVQEHVSRGTLSMGHARALLPLQDKELQTKVADEAIRAGLSVRALEERVRTIGLGSPTTPAVPAKGTTKARPVWVAELEENLVEAIGTSVSIRYGKKRSKIVIECAGREEFERVYKKLRSASDA